jgi:hypothetical protein
MPLWKRFLELGPKWREQCIDYRALKRNAESLVGRDDTADAWHAQEAQ